MAGQALVSSRANVLALPDNLVRDVRIVLKEQLDVALLGLDGEPAATLLLGADPQVAYYLETARSAASQAAGPRPAPAVNYAPSLGHSRQYSTNSGRLERELVMENLRFAGCGAP